jgi:hypothetical protein
MKRVLLVAAVVLGVLVLAWVGGDLKFGHDLQAELAWLHAAGQPVTLAEFGPQAVPDDQNAAPLYEQVLGITPQGDSVPGAGSFPRDLEGPITSMTHRETQAEYLQRLAVALQRPEVAQAFDKLEEASLRPCCVFAIPWGDYNVNRWGGLNRLQAAVGVLAGRAELECSRGNPDDALHWLAVGVRVARHAGAEPTLVPQLVRWSLLAVLERQAHPAVAALRSPGPGSQELQKALASLDLGADFAAAVRANPILAQEGLRGLVRAGYSHPPAYVDSMWPWEFRQRHAWTWILGNFGDRLRGQDRWWWPVADWVYLSPLGQPWRRYDALCSLRCTEQVASLVNLPYAQAQPAGEALVRQQTAHALSAPTALHEARSSISFTKLAYTQANLALWRVALSLQDYKFAHGQYPASLADLQKTLDWTIPLDPFSGQALLYRTEGAEFVVYSVGPDLRDDGGKPPAGGDWRLDEPGDIVWGSEWHTPPPAPVTPPPAATAPPNNLKSQGAAEAGSD